MSTPLRLATTIIVMLVFASLATSQDIPAGNTAPSFCKPCLWYSGDFDFNNSKSNAMTNERDFAVSRSAVYVPFTIPKGKTWTITGAFGVPVITTPIIDPARADWSFSTGVSTGHAGKVIKSGTSPATIALYGDHCGPAVCADVLVKGIHVTLKAGRYWMTVVPYCTNSNDSNCNGARYFLADLEDNPPLNHFGPKNLLDAAYVTSKQLGLFFMPTWGPSGACRGTGCDTFSMGLLGTAKDDK